MAEVLIIGINHFDPFGRVKIQSVLSTYANKGCIPDCICVEWKKELAEEVIMQREKFMLEVESTYPNITNNARVLADTMAFEVDSHQLFYPKTPIVWLDEGRNETKDDIKDYYLNRLSIYKEHLERQLSLQEIADNIIKRADTVILPNNRDNAFYQCVKELILDGNDRIICIVGAGHANINTHNSFANLLNNSGISINVADTTLS